MGYVTKYDCSSGDINPIGTLNKVQILELLRWFYEELGWPVIKDIIDAKPSAELIPIVDGKEQDDEEDLGLTYLEMQLMSKFRSESLCGPFSMFDMLGELMPNMDVQKLDEKIKIFFNNYSKNRHKTVVATPTVHLSKFFSLIKKVVILLKIRVMI